MAAAAATTAAFFWRAEICEAMRSRSRRPSRVIRRPLKHNALLQIRRPAISTTPRYKRNAPLQMQRPATNAMTRFKINAKLCYKHNAPLHSQHPAPNAPPHYKRPAPAGSPRRVLLDQLEAFETLQHPPRHGTRPDAEVARTRAVPLAACSEHSTPPPRQHTAGRITNISRSYFKMTLNFTIITDKLSQSWLMPFSPVS